MWPFKKEKNPVSTDRLGPDRLEFFITLRVLGYDQSSVPGFVDVRINTRVTGTNIMILPSIPLDFANRHFPIGQTVEFMLIRSN